MSAVGATSQTSVLHTASGGTASLHRLVRDHTHNPARVWEQLHALRKDLPLSLGTLALRPPQVEPGARSHATTMLFDALLCTGGVIELSGLSGSGALTLGFLLLAEAHRRAVAAGGFGGVLAFDPTRTFCAPALASLGVPLSELVVCRAPAERCVHLAVRAQRTVPFAGVLVDASEGHAAAPVSVRRWMLAAEAHSGFGIVVTSAKAQRALPLPTSARALVERVAHGIAVRMLRHKQGWREPFVVPLVRSA